MWNMTSCSCNKFGVLVFLPKWVLGDCWGENTEAWAQILPRTRKTRCLLLRTFLMKMFTVPFPPLAGILKISVTPLLELLFLPENGEWPRQGRPLCGFISFSQPFLLGKIDTSRIWLAHSISLQTSGYLQASAGGWTATCSSVWFWLLEPRQWGKKK